MDRARDIKPSLLLARWRSLWLVAVLSLVTAIGCGGETVSDSSSGGDAQGLGFGDGFRFGGGTTDASGGGGGGDGVQDAGRTPPDQTNDDSSPKTESDTAVGQNDDDTYSEPKGDTAGCPGGSGCPCVSADDCDSTLCLETVSGKRCAQTCIADCPPGNVCAALPLGSDFVQACVSAWARLCSPCASHADCNAPGMTGARCLDGGDGPDTCGSPCSADADCPSGSLCKSSLDVNGATNLQCVPAGLGGAPGTCSCTENAVNLGFVSTCQAKLTLEGADLVCAGTASCAAAGSPLTCSALAPSAEACDGIDNDCDGQLDEGTCDDGNGCTADTCKADGSCANAPLQTGSPCDADGSVCTVDDGCANGACKAGTLLGCDDGNPCTKDSCELASGCTQVAFDGVPCSDDNPCSLGDVCKEGGCSPGKPKVCVAPGPCYGVACDPNSGTCNFPPLQTGLPCDDGSACTAPDLCNAGVCGGALVKCDDGNPCTSDSCDPVKGCVIAPNNAPCDDGEPCTTQDVCGGGACAGQAKVCDDGNPCTGDTCAKGIGCKADAVADKSPCGSDGSTWCVAGKCATKSTSGFACGDASDCASGYCVEGVCCGSACAGGCESCLALWTGSIDGLCKPIKAGIDPDNECQAMDISTCGFTGQCNGAGSCAKHPVGAACSDAKCSDGKLQGAGVCGLSGCQPGPIQQCDDGDACTIGDGCTGGSCKAGVGKSCDDGNACTNDSCDANTGCKASPNSNGCDDGSACTLNDACSGGACKAGGSKFCNDGNPCTDDSCNPAIGCVYAPNNAQCDDGNACTIGDVCGGGGSCTSGANKNCDDGVACTVDSCSGGQCQHNAFNCCDPTPYVESFTGPNKGWSFSNSAGAALGWQILQTSPQAKSVSAAMYYGNPAANNYDFGNSSGSALSPLIPIPPGNASKLLLSLYLDTEQGTSYDVLTINLVLANGTKSSIWTKATQGVGYKKWDTYELVTTPYGGSSIRLEFVFATVDSIINATQGVFVDDLQLQVSCQ